MSRIYPSEQWLLSELLLNQGFSKLELADYLNISQQQINALLSEDSAIKLSITSKQRLIRAYSVSH